MIYLKMKNIYNTLLIIYCFIVKLEMLICYLILYCLKETLRIQLKIIYGLAQNQKPLITLEMFTKLLKLLNLMEQLLDTVKKL